jgi:hypothetical protein
VTLIINDTEHYKALQLYRCHYAEFTNLYIVVLNGIMLNVMMLSIFMLSVVVLVNTKLVSFILVNNFLHSSEMV